MPNPPTLIELYRAGAPRTPALLAPGRPALTFAALWDQVEGTVHGLNELGIGRGDAVAIVLPNGPAMATAFLGVAAGAVAAPLNPAYKADEFDFYLGDLGARALLVEVGSTSPAIAVARARGVPLIDLVEDPAGPVGQFALRGATIGSVARAGPGDATDTALVLHTSGTTSRPKMVPLSQGNLIASALAIGRALDLTPADRCLNVMPLFHIHGLIGALLAPLAAGSSVAVTEGFNALKFFAWLEELSPTWYSAVPTMHQAILGRAARNREIIARRPLRLIRSSSASLPPPVMAELESTFGAPVIESYGMTEATHQMASNPLPPGARKPGTVGIAAGPEIAIMDVDGVMVPQGAKGEVVIRGPNVTAGYANNADANAKAFTAGWFRTGDEGWLDADGYLTISGRLKEIINRGGEKIAPREVDEVLLAHPAVAQALAFAVPHRSLGEDVAAAVVLREGAAATEAELRAFAGERLAPFKVPRKVVILDTIPKGPTGKLQRIGLAERLGLTSGAPTAAADTSQRTPLEATVAKHWAAALNLTDVATDADFLGLGGDSLSAQILSSEIEHDLAVTLPLDIVFGVGSTVAGMAREIERLKVEGAGARAAPSLAGAADGAMDVPATGMQQAMWVTSQWNRDAPLYNVTDAMRLRGPLDRAALDAALRDLTRRHEVLRTTLRRVSGDLRQRILGEFQAPLAVHEVSGRSADERESAARAVVTRDAATPFDLDADPPWRPFLIRLAREDHVFGMTIHHALADGWARQVLARDLVALYRASVAKVAADLPAHPVRYADYAAWSRRVDAEGGNAADAAYWREHLGDVPLGVPLPRDATPPDEPTFASSALEFAIPAALAAEAKVCARRHQTTTFAVLMSAVAMAIGRLSGCHRLCLGVVAANRGYPDVADVAGCFVNVLPLRVDVEGQLSFADLLDGCHKKLMSGLARQTAPIERVLQDLPRKRVIAGESPISVQVQQRNDRVSWPRIAGALAIEPFMKFAPTQTWDLEFNFEERSGRLVGEAIFRTELFSPATIAGWVDELLGLLAWALANPSVPFARAPSRSLTSATDEPPAAAT